MFDRFYRSRLLQDLERWEASGALTRDAAAATRTALGPEPKSMGLAGYLAIAAALLLAGALLAFVASNWDGIARPVRLAMLLALIAGAYAAGAALADHNKPMLTNLTAFFGSLAFVASVALVGQMYNLPKNLAGGYLLCTIGTLAAAALTRSTGTLTVALVAAIAWSVNAMEYADQLHWPFLLAWLAAGGIAWAYDRPSARHLVAAAAVVWVAIGYAEQAMTFKVGNAHAAIAFFLGGAMFCAATRRDGIAALGEIVATYMFFCLAGAAFLGVADNYWRTQPDQVSGLGIQHGMMIAGLAGLGIAAAIGRARVLAVTGLVAMIAALILGQADIPNDFRLHGLLGLVVAAALIAGGAYAARRPVFVAGWIAFALVVGNLTWFAKPTFLERALFLAVAGAVAVIAAVALRRLETPRGDAR